MLYEVNKYFSSIALANTYVESGMGNDITLSALLKGYIWACDIYEASKSEARRMLLKKFVFVFFISVIVYELSIFVRFHLF